jgi:hypothetical protein
MTGGTTGTRVLEYWSNAILKRGSIRSIASLRSTAGACPELCQRAPFKPPPPIRSGAGSLFLPHVAGEDEGGGLNGLNGLNNKFIPALQQ